MDNRIEFKNYIKENFITLIFAIVFLISLIATDQEGFFIIDNLLSKVMGLTLITIALILPIKMGMGFNFSIGVGAMAAQFGIIIAVSLKLSGIFGILSSVFMATLLALILGYIVGFFLNMAKGHEMITSVFIGYAANGLYQYILLFLFGSIIPIKAAELVLSSGTGIRNTIDLQRTLFKSSDGILEVPAFFLLLLASIVCLVFLAIKLKKDKSIINISGILLSSLCLIISGLIMYTNLFSYKVTLLKNIKLPVLSVIIILAIILCNEFLIKDKIALKKIEANKAPDVSKKMRITVIVLSTVLVAWGQIILLLDLGILNTYGAHMSINYFAIPALIIGGATLKNATVKHAIIGLILFQSFYSITLPLFDGNSSGVAQMIIINCVYVYVFTKHYVNPNHLELNT